MAQEFDHILLIGFGGPEKPEEVRPFLEIVARGGSVFPPPRLPLEKPGGGAFFPPLDFSNGRDRVGSQGRAIPEERLREVAHHYEAIGGRSPYNQSVFRLARKLQEALDRQAITLPVFVGMRNWHPFLKEVLREIKSRKFRKGIGIVLAVHRSEASYDRYVQAIEEAKQDLGLEGYECVYLKPWHDHPLFIQAQAEQVRRTLEHAWAEKKARSHLLFTAHSIPVEMAEQCRYVDAFQRSCELVAEELVLRSINSSDNSPSPSPLPLEGGEDKGEETLANLPNSALDYSDWSLAYQSRSGDSNQPWLEPDVCAVIRALKAKESDSIVVVPIGFLCDNAEILYDLDIEAQQEAVRSGIRYFRTSTVIDHPKFAALLTELIQEELAKQLC